MNKTMTYEESLAFFKKQTIEHLKEAIKIKEHMNKQKCPKLRSIVKQLEVEI